MTDAAAAPPLRLRVAVVASSEAARRRLTTLVTRSGHDVVEVDGSPDAILTDDASSAVPPARAVLLGWGGEEFAGWLASDAGPAQVDAALRAVAAGLTVCGTPLQTRGLDPLPEDPQVLLTPREIEVLAALGNGLTNKETARRLGISPNTVKFHIESLFRKLDAATRAEAVAKGIRLQVVDF